MQTQADILARTRPRRAWDERLPDGRTVAEMIREKLTSPVTATAQQPANGQQVRYSVPGQQSGGQMLTPRNQEAITRPRRTWDDLLQRGPVSPTAPLPNHDPNQPGQIQLMAGGQQEPQTLLPATSTESASTYDPNGTATRQPIAGGRGDLARLQTMNDYPTRQVNPDGSAGLSHPLSRRRAAIIGWLRGMETAAQSRDNPSTARVLLGGLPGLAKGAFDPSAVQRGERDIEVQKEQGRLAAQTKLLTGQEQLDHLRAETESLRQGGIQYIERNDGVYAISKEYPNGRRVGNIPAEARSGANESFHFEPRDDGVYAISNQHPEKGAFKIGGMPGKPASTKETYDVTLPDGTVVKATAGEAISAAGNVGKTTGVRKAKIEESQSLYHKAEALDANASALDEHIKKLKDGYASLTYIAPEGQTGDHVPSEEQTKEYRQQIKALEDQKLALQKEARGLRENGDKARAEGEAIPETVPTPRGRRKALEPALEKRIRDAAIAKGLNPDIAVERARARQ